MPDLLGATNPVPGYESNSINRNVPISPESTQIQNVTDPNRVVRPDGKTEQQDSSAQGGGGQLRFDSNFQTFLQRLRATPDMAETVFRTLLGRNGVVVSSGVSEGIAAEMAQLVQMLQMDKAQLLDFLAGQLSSGSRLNGALFSLLRNAYANAASDDVRVDILLFLKAYLDHTSSGHIERNLLRSLRGMAAAMPASWAEPLRELTAQLENGIAAGSRNENIALLQRQIFPYMSNYVGQTHDIGMARAFLTLLTLDTARYENGTEENMLETFRRMSSYGTLKEQLGGINDADLAALLAKWDISKPSAANRYADQLAATAARVLRGEGGAELQQGFQNLVSAMLLNESVYMPLNHLMLPLEMDGRMLFSEIWIDPDAGDSEAKERGGEMGGAIKLLLKMDIQSLGMFDIIVTHRSRETSLQISCPEPVAARAGAIARDLADILRQNGLSPGSVDVRRMGRPVALTEVFPKIFEGMNSINVKA